MSGRRKLSLDDDEPVSGSLHLTKTPEQDAERIVNEAMKGVRLDFPRRDEAADAKEPTNVQ